MAPLTSAEKQRRYRARLKERLEAAAGDIPDRNPATMTLAELEARLIAMVRELVRRARQGGRSE